MHGLVALFSILAVAFVGFSILSRTSWSLVKAANAPSWRFYFFVVWVLLLPAVLLFEWWGPEVNGFGGWSQKVKEIPSVPAMTYARKVISDLWAAVAVVLAAQAWNKP